MKYFRLNIKVEGFPHRTARYFFDHRNIVKNPGIPGEYYYKNIPECWGDAMLVIENFIAYQVRHNDFVSDCEIIFTDTLDFIIYEDDFQAVKSRCPVINLLRK